MCSIYQESPEGRSAREDALYGGCSSSHIGGRAERVFVRSYRFWCGRAVVRWHPSAGERDPR